MGSVQVGLHFYQSDHNGIETILLTEDLKKNIIVKTIFWEFVSKKRDFYGDLYLIGAKELFYILKMINLENYWHKKPGR